MIPLVGQHIAGHKLGLFYGGAVVTFRAFSSFEVLCIFDIQPISQKGQLNQQRLSNSSGQSGLQQNNALLPSYPPSLNNESYRLQLGNILTTEEAPPSLDCHSHALLFFLQQYNAPLITGSVIPLENPK